MVDSKKYDGSTWEHSLRKLTTATETIENPLYSDGTAITNYTIKGNTVQTGTPTPDNPVDVNGVGERTENMFPLVESKLHVGRIETNGTIDYQVGTITIDGNSITYQADTAWKGFYTDYIQTAGNAYLTIAPNVGNSVSWSCSCYNTNNEFLGRASIAYSSSAAFFTLREGTTKVMIAVVGEYNQYTIQNPMLNTGSTAKPYEPYGYKIPISSAGQTIDIYIGDLPLLKSLDDIAVDEIGNGTLTRRVDSDGSVLPAPITTRITMPSIPTTDGANSITVDTTVQPSEFTATWTGWHNATVKEWDGSDWS